MRRIRDMVLGGVLVLTLVGSGFFGRGLVEEDASASGNWTLLIDGGNVGYRFYIEAIKGVSADCAVLVAEIKSNYAPSVFINC